MAATTNSSVTCLDTVRHGAVGARVQLPLKEGEEHPLPKYHTGQLLEQLYNTAAVWAGSAIRLHTAQHALGDRSLALHLTC